MPRKNKEQREAEKREQEEKESRDRLIQDQLEKEELYPRLFAVLEQCSAFNWDFKVVAGTVIVDRHNDTPIPVLGPNYSPWELNIIESYIEEEHNKRSAAARKEALRQDAWSKLSPDEREALGMRRE